MTKIYLSNRQCNSLFLSVISVVVSLSFTGCKKYVMCTISGHGHAGMKGDIVVVP